MKIIADNLRKRRLECGLGSQSRIHGSGSDCADVSTKSPNPA